MTSRQDRSRPGVVRRARFLRVGRSAGVLLTASALAGCAVGGSATGQGPSTSPRADLAAQAEVAAGNLEQPPQGRQVRSRAARDGRRASGRPGARPRVVAARPGATAKTSRGSGTQAAATGSRPDAATTETGWAPVLTVTDPAGDQGGAPGYADLRSVLLEDDGRHLRVTVQLGAVVPGRLGDGEVEGVGVDLFRPHAQESDHQLFLDGGGHGWRGFLQTPRGFVAYPGTLTVRGAVLTTTVPWAALGGRRDGEVSTFVDWSDGSGRAGADQVERTALRLS